MLVCKVVVRGEEWVTRVALIGVLCVNCCGGQATQPTRVGKTHHPLMETQIVYPQMRFRPENVDQAIFWVTRKHFAAPTQTGAALLERLTRAMCVC